MTNEKQVSFIRYFAKQWSAMLEFEPPIEGCTDEEIEDIRRSQGVPRLPALYVEFIRKFGRKTGGLEWECGMDLTYPKVCDFKKFPLRVLRDSNVFIFGMNGYEDALSFFNVAEDDPIVYWATIDIDVVEDIGVINTGEFPHLKNYRFSDWLIDFTITES
ncbi:MAG: hypothetical protein RLP44_23240 [Aggregatilineales bacterium]